MALEDGGKPFALENLMVLTRGEHIDLHRAENEPAGAAAWRDMIDEMLSKIDSAAKS